MCKILGISGKKSAGKDTLANAFFNHCRFFLNKKVEIIPFALALKDTCQNLFSIKKKSIYGTEEQKNELTYYKWSDMPNFVSENIYEKIKSSGIDPKDIGLFTKNDSYMTGREFLQFFGTEICRKISDNIHIQATFTKINSLKRDFFIIPDVRFVNEVKSIQENGGYVVRLNRGVSSDTHSSEKELDDFKNFDLIIDNSKLSVDKELSLLNKFLTKKGWFK